MSYFKSSGFSLIEVLIVVAIVAVLSAIAIPAYKNYLLLTRIATVVPTFDKLIQQSIQFANMNGRFPYASDLNLASGTHNNIVSNPQEVNSLFIRLWINDASTQLANCGQYANIGAELDLTALGLGENGVVGVQCLLWHAGGSINNYCSYWQGIDGQSTTGTGLIPGWPNQNSGTDYDYNIYYDYKAKPPYSTATCITGD